MCIELDFKDEYSSCLLPDNIPDRIGGLSSLAEIGLHQHITDKAKDKKLHADEKGQQGKHGPKGLGHILSSEKLLE